MDKLTLNKKTTAVKSNEKKTFYNFEEKYEYHTNNLLDQLGKFEDQLTTNTFTSFSNEEIIFTLKKLKDDKENNKHQVSEVENDLYILLEKYNKARGKAKGIEESSSPFGHQLKQLSEVNTILENKKRSLEKEIAAVTNKIRNEKDEKKNMNTLFGRYSINIIHIRKSKSINKYNEIENIEKEIMESKISALKKELALKDKQIRILRDRYTNAEDSEESLNNDDIGVGDFNNSYLNFEEEFNVTNNSNDSIKK
jgi:chromosome segregation ATPase